MKEFWDQRFSINEFVYGKAPNNFVAAFLDNHAPGKAFFPGEGEGRNAVYAAKLGWQCDCFDYSEEGRNKAMHLAQENGVSINYHLGDITKLDAPENSYDAVFLTFLHLQPQDRTNTHKQLVKSLKPGGHIVMEVFDKKQIDMNTGGPKNPEMLYSPKNLEADFQDIQILKNDMDLRYMEEGAHHIGEAFTIHFIARK